MSARGGTVCEDDSGNSELDWEIFEVLTQEAHHHHSGHHHHSDLHHVTTPILVTTEPHHGHHHHHDHHSIDLVTTLRSELAASTYKRDRLINELSEAKSSLCAKDTECETLRAQTARQSALISSLQARLQAAEERCRTLQARSESTAQTLQRDKRTAEERSKEMCAKIRRLECELGTEEAHREQARAHLHDLVRRLCLCLGVDVCDSSHVTPETVLTKAGEVVGELQRLRNKVASACEGLSNCESELMNVKALSSADKQRLQAQIETLQTLSQELEARCRQGDRELQIARDRLAESEVNGEKLREELRGFESRCHRLQSTLDRHQSDRLQFLRNLATVLSAPEPCETIIKDRLRDVMNDNQSMHAQIVNLREQLNMEQSRHREAMDTATCRMKADEMQRCTVEERLEKAHAELQAMKAEHHILSDFLARLGRALNWSECPDPPAHGTETTILAESLLERAERLAMHHDHHIHGMEHHHGPHHSHLPKLRREKSCHDLSLKESSTVYSLQRRVRVLREQVQRRDLHLELLRRKIALLEDGNRARTMLQTERDEALHRARRSCKQAEKTSQQLCDVKSQLHEVKSQLAEAADFKITALERARKIDELQARVIDLESEKDRLLAQLTDTKTRARSAVETSHDRKLRDDTTITKLRDELARVKSHLTEAHHRLQHMQTFRTSVARLLHLRDLPEADLLHRLQTLCNAHQEFTLLSRRYESASPVGEHPCPRFDDLMPPSSTCRPLSSSPRHCPRFEDDFDDEFKYC